jgi:dipeptidase E
LVLPLACEEEDFQEVFERVEECFEDSKIESIDMIKKVKDLTHEKISQYHAVFVEGGNTFKLIKALRDTHLFQYLKAFLKEDKIIYADSAGAIALGANIESGFLGEAADEDELKIQDWRGLGFLGNWSVHCHHEPEDLDALNDLMYASGSTFLALSEPCGIHIKNNTVRVLGSAPLEIVDFTGSHRHPPGAVVEMDFSS